MSDPPAVDLTIGLCLVANTALSVGAGGSAGTLADKTIVRDGYGRPIIPGSQLKGKLRHAAEALARSLAFANLPIDFDDETQPESVITQVFGSPNQRASLVFADLVGVVGETNQIDTLKNEPEQRRSQIRPSVALNRRRRVAEDARLLFQETSIEGMRFVADRAIVGTVPDASYAGLLWAALLLTTRWGGASSRGLGWMTIEQLTITCDGQTTTMGNVAAESQPFADALRTLTAREQAGGARG